jgi:peptidoglycan/LPS O-acetylase OafA/YrhL
MAALLPAFFALSGFLVSGSLERTRTVPMFLGLRALRILPALAVESLIAALILGPLLTTLPLKDYVASPLFWQYFLNIAGIPQYHLPGVFAHNPIDRVNGQLWTIPFELRCYLTIALLALLGAVRRRGWLVVATIAYLAYGVIATAVQYPQDLTSVAGPLPGWLLVESFLVGVLIHVYRDRLPWRWSWGVGSLAAGLALLAVPVGQYLAIAPLAYATVFFGLTNPRKSGFLKGADYSYGIFLYGFVIQQTFVALAPWGRHWWINIAVAAPVATLVAAASWHLVEKPALGLRKHLAKLEAAWIARTEARADAQVGARAPAR